MSLCAALAVHVADEAATDFLSVYNPNAQAIRARTGLPLPSFTFETWLLGLIVAIVLLLALAPFAFRGARWIARASFVFAGLMLLNGLGHITSSVYMGRLMPGAYSSPLLLASSVFLLVTARKRLLAISVEQRQRTLSACV